MKITLTRNIGKIYEKIRKKKKREREIIDQSCRSKALSYLGITVYERFLLFTKTNVMYRGVRANCLGLPYEK